VKNVETQDPVNARITRIKDIQNFFEFKNNSNDITAKAKQMYTTSLKQHSEIINGMNQYNFSEMDINNAKKLMNRQLTVLNQNVFNVTDAASFMLKLTPDTNSIVIISRALGVYNQTQLCTSLYVQQFNELLITFKKLMK
jgi:hypothetical protein